MVKLIKQLVKAGIAGVVAIACISLMLCVYSVTPVHKENTAKNTDYVWAANSWWIKMTEGISYGKYDANGYNNEKAIENPDVVVLGSSHTEATNVMQDENAAYLLKQKLNKKLSVYNMGISGHSFRKVCQYLPANMELFDKAPEITIIETGSVKITAKDAESVLNHSVEQKKSYSDGIIGKLQRIPFFRSIYQQIQGGLLKLFMPAKTESSNGNNAADVQVEVEAYDKVFSYIEDIQSKYKTTVIVVYHPTETILEDGSIDYSSDIEHLKAFSDYAEKHNVSFIDLTESFEKMYYEDHYVAHGFPTGELGTGHLNKYGHAAMADALYNEILKLEEGK